MKKNILWGLFIIASTIFISCSSDNDTVIDKEKPTININGDFQNCVEIQKGVPFIFTAEITDNEGLGSYSFDIHHNFDHHTHSTEAEVTECKLGVKKEATNPFKLVETSTVKGSPKTYTIKQEFTIPKKYEEGDYHFMLKVVDKAGWSTIKGLSFKLKE